MDDVEKIPLGPQAGEGAAVHSADKQNRAIVRSLQPSARRNEILPDQRHIVVKSVRMGAV